ncbi:histidine phosphatase superfamily [Rhodocollybia butyracea]|uniref:Histidine phosphatase superfamily n=1 Tax=Rhodocollybia butyracea TaxID=206335 RepID=A0A9P5UET9_9AGAR|nr:histidine phosphatase superfamily [Rhodocollybia butyracea]
MLFLSSFIVSSFLLVASVPIKGQNPSGTTPKHSDTSTVPHDHDVAQLQSLWLSLLRILLWMKPMRYRLAAQSTRSILYGLRHGSRYPTKSQNKLIKNAVENFVEKVKKLVDGGKITDPELLKFLTSLSGYKYTITSEQEEQLTELGKMELLESGKLQYLRYKHLITDGKSVSMSSSNAQRVRKSAAEWIKGFGVSGIAPPTIIEQEHEKAASTVVRNDYMKPWKKIYLPRISESLKKTLQVELTNDDVLGLIMMCPFETSILRKDKTSSTALSPFCKIFSMDQFKDFAWQGVLDKYYRGTSKTISRNGLSPTGYTKDLYSRLIESKESSPKFYALFSHDNEMAGIFHVLGLFLQDKVPSPKAPDDSVTYKTSEVVPFAARLLIERMTCKHSGSLEFVRVLVNNAVQPLKWCHGVKNGLCEVKEFIKGPLHKA